jgi:hypothetical protein
MIKEVIGIIGLILIIFGDFTIYKNKKFRTKYTYPVLIIGGIFLAVYSYLIRDKIFIILQIAYIIGTSYGYIKIKEKK